MESTVFADTMIGSELLEVTSIDVSPALPLIGEFLRIRDRIVIDEKLQKKMEDSAALNVTLIGRVIEHAPSFNLKLPGRIVRLVASSYDARGG